jgi:phosphatidylglycerol:prolipoprotein diacylglycerol transferase
MEEFDFRGDAIFAAADADPELAARFEQWPDASLGLKFEWMKEAQIGNPAISEAIAPFLEPRHPSQLYQAAMEGLLLFLILWFVRVKFPKAPHGLLTGLFFIGYAVFRIIGEAYREPDSKLVLNDMLTSGQFLSLFMIAGGAVFIAIAVKRGPARTGS